MKLKVAALVVAVVLAPVLGTTVMYLAASNVKLPKMDAPDARTDARYSNPWLM